MARRTITYNGTSLQSTNIVTSEILHESVNHRELNYQKLAEVDGAKPLQENFDVRTIVLKGKIKGSSIDDLEERIDALKQALAPQEKNLDIEYASGIRRYICSCTRITIERSWFHLNFAPFELEFTCADPPHGLALDTSTAEYTVNTIATYYGSFVAKGTRRPMPRIEITVTSQTDLQTIYFRNVNTNSTMSISRTFSNGDVLVIDTSDFTVTINGEACVYEGVFPEFVQGDNDFRIWAKATDCVLDIKLIYYPLFL